MRIPYEKYHGTGNDFVVVSADAPVPDRRAFAIAHCDRETGVGTPGAVEESDGDREAADVGGRRIGADGVLFLALDEEVSPPRVEMTLYQPDGGTAAMCGNGARCAALWAARRLRRLGMDDRAEPASTRRKMGDGHETFAIDTPAGIRRATVDDGGITVEMGVPSFDPGDVPVDSAGPMIATDLLGYEVSAVDTGVPHAVILVDEVNDVDLEAMAPPIRHADVFPEGANVTVASPRAEGGFTQRTFERGVEGETQACGTGAVAIVAVAKRLGLYGGAGPVPVSPPGGELSITIPDDGSPVTLRGPASYEWRGTLPAVPEVEP